MDNVMDPLDAPPKDTVYKASSYVRMFMEILPSVSHIKGSWLIESLRPAYERRCYSVTTSVIGGVQT